MSFNSKQEYESILWTADKHLSWSDFKGDAPKNDRAAVITYRFSTSGARDDIKDDFEITAHFYPNKSWYQPELCDDVILSHEQLHFDISELYARKMEERLANTKFTQNIKAEVKIIYKEILEELNEFQNTYDNETNFSRDREEQQRWNKKIAMLLNE